MTKSLGVNTALWIGAGLEVQQGKEIAQVAEALNELADASLKEPGCFMFKVLHNKEDPQRFTLWECWENEDALAAHFEEAHTKDYMAQELTQVSYIERLNSDDRGLIR